LPASQTLRIMIKRAKLYDAFGELLYAIAIADGAVQEEEIRTLKRVLCEHPWAREIEWSFEYENQKHHSLEEAYQKAVDICKENGPDPEYHYLLDVMVKVAEAFGGIIPQEKRIIDNFKNELMDRFMNDLKDNKLVTLQDE